MTTNSLSDLDSTVVTQLLESLSLTVAFEDRSVNSDLTDISRGRCLTHTNRWFVRISWRTLGLSGETVIGIRRLARRRRPRASN